MNWTQMNKMDEHKPMRLVYAVRNDMSHWYTHQTIEVKPYYLLDSYPNGRKSIQPLRRCETLSTDYIGILSAFLPN